VPQGRPLCETQTPTVAELSKGGNGCDETLMWWVTDYLNPPKSDGKKPKDEDAPTQAGPREFTMADLPKQCKGVLPRTEVDRVRAGYSPHAARMGQVSATLQKTETPCAAFCPGIIAMAVIVVASNILVQFPLGGFLTWGALTYPFAFLVTDL
jgi:hypothetical protein